MAVTLDDLEEAGFAVDNWPEDLPQPGEDNVSREEIGDSEYRFRFEIEDSGQAYGMEVDLDTSTVPDPAEGVVFMLNQFAFLWRTDKGELEKNDGGSVRRIDF
jgi:hypothetical protein